MVSVRFDSPLMLLALCRSRDIKGMLEVFLLLLPLEDDEDDANNDDFEFRGVGRPVFWMLLAEFPEGGLVLETFCFFDGIEDCCVFPGLIDSGPATD